MPINQLQGLVARQRLTITELHAIKDLVTLCDAADQLHARIDWGMLTARPGITVLDFLYYTEAKLVGYLALDSWGIDERELMGVVHPAYRRRGIFRTLLRAAAVESKQLGVEHLVLVCEHASTAGQAFVTAIGATYDFSEHEMVLDQLQERRVCDARLHFRQATLEDSETLVTILVDSFGDAEAATRHRVLRSLQDPTRRFFLATFAASATAPAEPVGCLRLDSWDHVMSIYSFGVRAAYQGRGYGRQMLEEIIRRIHSADQQTITLDVNSTNRTALALYTSCGFRIKATYDYYRFPLA